MTAMMKTKMKQGEYDVVNKERRDKFIKEENQP